MEIGRFIVDHQQGMASVLHVLHAMVLLMLEFPGCGRQRVAAAGFELAQTQKHRPPFATPEHVYVHPGSRARRRPSLALRRSIRCAQGRPAVGAYGLVVRKLRAGPRDVASQRVARCWPVILGLRTLAEYAALLFEGVPLHAFLSSPYPP